ncbi:hypothetical protein FHS82_002687 [Pseudochelatococcus lubricantis]|uniref:Metal-binding protein n=1 Tax=Pseudochelatococcus lubricantis TaxID=1538102 RepID=A0ABX0V0W6_9HYPH|nr:DUF411 domain-containing protein [Pseudochelatococcus lubricantis]NIJ58832.1 hypothetical protein [Pseudochelatococcus lubricantis]
MGKLTRRVLLGVVSINLAVPIACGLAFFALAAPPAVDVFRSPDCGCCGGWIEHMRLAGFTVNERLRDDPTPVKAQFGVPEDLYSCHTAVIDGYIIEGHVPAGDIRRLLRERPAATGFAVPGMPAGSPGMEVSDTAAPYDVILFGPSERKRFSRH